METDWISALKGAAILGIHCSEFPRVAQAAGIRYQLLPGRKRIRYDVKDVERLAAESIFTSSDGPQWAAVGAGADAPESPENSTTTPAKSAKARPGPSRHATKAHAEEAP